MMLHVPHVVEQQLTIAHSPIFERTRVRNPSVRHSRQHNVQLPPAVVEVTAQFVFSVAGLRYDDLVVEFTQTERCWRTESRFVFRGEIQVEAEKHVERQIPKQGSGAGAREKLSRTRLQWISTQG